MKSTIISMIIVLAVMAVVPMLFLGEGNLAEQFGFGGFGNSTKSNKPVKLPKNVKQVVTNKRIEVYTWVDEYGVKQFSNTPPPEGGDSEKMVLSPDTNVISAMKLPKQEEEVAARPKVYSLGSPYTPGGMKDVIDNSLDVRETLNQRQADQEQAMQEIFNNNKK